MPSLCTLVYMCMCKYLYIHVKRGNMICCHSVNGKTSKFYEKTLLSLSCSCYHISLTANWLKITEALEGLLSHSRILIHVFQNPSMCAFLWSSLDFPCSPFMAFGLHFLISRIKQEIKQWKHERRNQIRNPGESLYLMNGFLTETLAPSVDAMKPEAVHILKISYVLSLVRKIRLGNLRRI